jgi:quinol-cytochrome oxidoreductase complex cytochrome b subunit
MSRFKGISFTLYITLFLLKFRYLNLKFLNVQLHIHGSNNPNGVTGHSDRVGMYPYFIFKDLVTFFAFFLVLSIIVFFYPNLMGHSDNYIPGNPMQTPASIVPE